MNKRNIYSLPGHISSDHEIVERLAEGKNTIIERIVSAGHVTSKNDWYDQDRDEWVVLLRGNADILFDDRSEVHMKDGDTLFIPAHKQHRVTYTSVDPPCVWLAVHAEMREC